MKQKKQIKIIISLLAMIAVLFGGWGLLRTKGLKAQEPAKEVKKTVPLLNDLDPLPIADDWQPINEYTEKWKDIVGSYIPADFLTSFFYLPGKTKVVIPANTKEKIKNIDSYTDDGYIIFDTDKVSGDNSANIFLENVGFSDGAFYSLEAVISYIRPAEKDEYENLGRIFTNNSNLHTTFLSVWFPRSTEGVNVTFRLCNIIRNDEENDEKIEVKYLTDLNLAYTFNRINIHEYLTFANKDIVDVYAGTTDQSNGDLSSLLLYDKNAISKGILEFNNPNYMQYTDEYKWKTQATLLFKSVSELSYTARVNETAMAWKQHVGIGYDTSTLVKNEFPPPQKTERTFTEIIDNGEEKNSIKGISSGFIEPLNFGFIQQIPWESALPINNRTQLPSWEIEEPKQTTDIISPDDWSIAAQDDSDLGDEGNVIDWFTISDNQGGARLTTKGDWNNTDNAFNEDSPLASDDFYNHFYLFNRELQLKYIAEDGVTKNRVNKELEEDEDKDDKKFFMLYNGTVSLDVDDKHKVSPGQDGMYAGENETTYETKINFYAPIEYKYIDSVTKKEIPAGSLPPSAKATGDGIVTWDAPLTPMSFDEYGTNGQIPTEKTSAPTIAGYTFKTATFNGDSVSSENLAQVKVTKLLKDGGDATKAEDYTQNNVVTLEYQPIYTVDVQVGALDTDGKFGTIPFAPPSGTSAPYVTVQETTAPTTPENAISPTGTEPAAEFTFPTTYDFEVGTGKSYKVTQMENVNSDYTKPDQSTSPDFAINDQNQLVVDGNEVSNSTYQGEDFILSWDATNKKLTIQIINQPNGEYQLVSVAPLDYGKVSLPQKNPDELIKRQDADWKVQFTDTRLEAYRTRLKLSVRLDQNFTNTNDPTKTISGILLYRPNATTPITPDDFLIEGEEIPIKEKINPNSGTNDIDWPEQAGFLLQIDAEKQTKIFAGDYQAELTFILSEDPL